MTSEIECSVLPTSEPCDADKAVSAQQCELFVITDDEASKLMVFSTQQPIHPTVMIKVSTDYDQTGNKGMMMTARIVRTWLSVFRSL